MAMNDFGGWQGRLWTLFFMLPFVLLYYFINLNYSNLVGEELYFFIFLVVMSIAWLFGLYYAIKWVKKVINNK